MQNDDIALHSLRPGQPAATRPCTQITLGRFVIFGTVKTGLCPPAQASPRCTECNYLPIELLLVTLGVSVGQFEFEFE